MVFSFLPAVSRRVIAVMGVLAVVAAASISSIKAQPAQTPAPAPEPRMQFPADAKVGLIYFTVKDTAAADFESVLPKLKEALAKSENPLRKQQAAGWKFFRIPTAGGTAVFLCLVDPVVKGADYDPIKILGEGFPAEVGDFYKKIKDAAINMAAIEKLSDMAGGPGGGH